MNDLVKRLRASTTSYTGRWIWWIRDLILEAADEIERLQAIVDKLDTTEDNIKLLSGADTADALQNEIIRLRRMD